MPISHEAKLIFIHIPKNAGTAITNYFAMDDDGHHNAAYYIEKYPDYWPLYKKISVIRNPWERVVSCYKYARLEKSYWHASDGNALDGKHPDYDLLKNKSFEECLYILENKPDILKHPGWKNQGSYIVSNGELLVDKIIHINALNKELSNIIGRKMAIPVINNSTDQNYKTFYPSQKLKNIVAKKYLFDIEYFGFKYDHACITG